MSRSLRLAAIALAFALPACSSPDEQPKKTGPLFEALDYRVNAFNYFDAKQWDRARQQFERSLVVEPGNWSAQLGIAACDLYQGRDRMTVGDPRAASALIDRADRRVAELWDGTTGADTQATAGALIQPWRAALIHAEIKRSLGELALFEATDLESRVQASAPADPRRREWQQRAIARKAEGEVLLNRALEVYGQLSRMENAAPDAIYSHAELLARFRRRAESEREYLRFTAIAESTRQAFIDAMGRVDQDYSDLTAREIARQALETKRRSNEARQILALDRLGAIRFEAAALEADGERRAQHLSQAVSFLERARGIDPTELRLLIRLAQCEGELGLYESALDRLETYFKESARRGRDFGEELNQAYQLRESLKEKQALARDA